MSLSCLKFGKKWWGGSPPGKGKGRPGKACEKGWTNPGKGGGWPPGPGGRALGGDASPLRLKGAPILGNNPWGRGKENGSLGEGRPRREKISWLLLAAWAACLKIKIKKNMKCYPQKVPFIKNSIYKTEYPKKTPLKEMLNYILYPMSLGHPVDRG